MNARRPSLPRRLVGAILFVGAVLAASACCSSSTKAMDDGFCKVFRDNWLQTCNPDCLKQHPGKTADCTKTCEANLLKDPTWSSKCAGK